MNVPEKKKRPRKQFDAVGGEPVIINPSIGEFVRALNWFNNQWTPDNAKKWLVSYMKKNEYDEDSISLVSSKVRKVIPTAASLARLYTNGSVIDSKYHSFIKDSVDTIVDAKQRVELDADGNPIIIVRVTKAKTVPSEMLEYIDELVDRSLAGEKITVDIYKSLVKMEATKFHLDELKDEYSSLLQELQELQEGKDKQLEEAYRNVSWKSVKNTIDLLNQMFNQFKQLKAVKKAVIRKPRAKKPPKIEKIIARLKYQKQSEEFRIASIDPSKLIGAKYLLTFNTKTRVMSIYYGLEGGFMIKGSSLVNFDTEKSIAKKLRKPQDVLPATDTRINAERQFKQLKTTATPANGRMNDTTVIYRVWS